jgi:hypothetical protein
MQIVYPMGNTFVKGGSRGQVRKGEGVPLTLPPRFARAPSLSPRWGLALQEQRLKGAGGRRVGGHLLPLAIGSIGSPLAHLAIFFASRKEQGAKLRLGKRRDPLACADPPLTVKVAVSEGQSGAEVSFGEGKTPSPRRLSASAPLPRPLLPRKTADFDTVYSQAGGDGEAK